MEENEHPAKRILATLDAIIANAPSFNANSSAVTLWRASTRPDGDISDYISHIRGFQATLEEWHRLCSISNAIQTEAVTEVIEKMYAMVLDLSSNTVGDLATTCENLRLPVSMGVWEITPEVDWSGRPSHRTEGRRYAMEGRDRSLNLGAHP